MAVSHRLDDEDLLGMALVMLDHDFAVETDAFPDTVAGSMLDELWPDPLAFDSLQISPASTMEGDIHTCPRENQDVSLKSRRYRNRKREELQLLRNTVQTLEVRLGALKSLPTKVISPIDSSRRVWEAVAIVESERRQESEHQNKELREMTMLHYQLAQKLQDVLRKVGAQCGGTPAECV